MREFDVVLCVQQIPTSPEELKLIKLFNTPLRDSFLSRNTQTYQIFV